MDRTATRVWAIGDVIDLGRYPIAEPDAAQARSLIQDCRSQLKARGACQLEGFMRPQAVEAVLREASTLVGRAHRTEATHNVYFSKDQPALPADDPRRLQVRSAKRAIGWNQIGSRSPLRLLYEWHALTEFIRAAVELPVLYRDADPVGACSIMFYDEGDELGWHFDNSEFAVTLMLQASEGGGSFEFVPRIRDAHDERLGEVSGILAGTRDRVLSLDGPPGTLALFQGRHSVHRVTPVEGKTPRVNAVLAYAQEPDHRLTQLNRELFYGKGE
jgi:alkylated DNA repair dioxygenase AlkB